MRFPSVGRMGILSWLWCGESEVMLLFGGTRTKDLDYCPLLSSERERRCLGSCQLSLLLLPLTGQDRPGPDNWHLNKTRCRYYNLRSRQQILNNNTGLTHWETNSQSQAHKVGIVMADCHCHWESTYGTVRKWDTAMANVINTSFPITSKMVNSYELN